MPPLAEQAAKLEVSTLQPKEAAAADRWTKLFSDGEGAVVAEFLVAVPVTSPSTADTGSDMLLHNSSATRLPKTSNHWEDSVTLILASAAVLKAKSRAVAFMIPFMVAASNDALQHSQSLLLNLIT
jgi:hypothetical protein